MTHFRSIHPFPARMASELALEELAEQSSPVRVLDPMAGSGTTLVAARLRGHHAIGFDRDPLAVLLSSTWVADIGIHRIEALAAETLKKAEVVEASLQTRSAYPAGCDSETQKFIRYWFDSTNRKQLTALSICIAEVSNKEARNVLWCAFSRLIITKSAGVSLAMDVSHSRPHRCFKKAPLSAFQQFPRAVKHILRSAPFTAKSSLPKARVIAADARCMPLEEGAVDLIITSPPYLNAIDYLRGHKLSLVWMGHSIESIRKLRSSNVGAETPMPDGTLRGENKLVVDKICLGQPLEKRQLGMLYQYVADLRSLLKECHRVLSEKGKAIFVVGNCQIKETFVSNSVAIETLGLDAGFLIECSRRRPLPENRRYLPPPDTKSSGKALQKRMREEVILTLRRV